MNKLLSFISIATLGISAAAAQNLVFEQGFENHPDAVEVLSFSAEPATIYENETSTLSWELKDASSCSTSNGTAAWQALMPGNADDSFDVTTLSTAGSYPFTLTCVGPIGEPSVSTTSIVVQVPPPVEITSFVATPDAIVEGEITTLSWTVVDAVGCTTSGGNAQWQAQSLDGEDGSVQLTGLNTEGVYGFDLVCEGIAGDLDIATVEVTVAAAPTCDAPTLDGHNNQWNDFWQTPGGQSFPQTGLPRVTTNVPSRRYMSIEFNTGTASYHGQFSLINSVFSKGLRLGAISQCEGQFDVPARCSHTWGTGSGIRWETDGTANSCSLEPNTTYFLNLTYTDGTDPNSSRCDLSISGTCQLIVDSRYFQ